MKLPDVSGVYDYAGPTRDSRYRPRRFAFHQVKSVGVLIASFVGSRTGAMLRRFGLAVAPRFLWECLTSKTVSWFPAPATSNAACGFPALRSPVRFTARSICPQGWKPLSKVVGVSAYSRCIVRAADSSTPYSTASILCLCAIWIASDVA
jgi:hypothetical protein